MKIYLVEDDKELNSVINKSFNILNYELVAFQDGKEAFEAIDNTYDLYLVDLNLPQVNGIEIIKKIKEVNLQAKIFVISAEINIETIINAYDIGCTDYIKKPFDIREIVKKIQSSFEDNEEEIIEFSKFKKSKYDLKNRIFIHGKKEIKLTKKEAQLLELLTNNRNVYLSNEEIQKTIWGDDPKPYVRQLVGKLRKKLPIELIENHSLKGYRVLS